MDQGEENERRRKGGKKVFLLIHAPYFKVVHNADNYGEKDGERRRNRLLLIEKV